LTIEYGQHVAHCLGPIAQRSERPAQGTRSAKSKCGLCSSAWQFWHTRMHFSTSV
jgi:hypothetical protein